MTEELEVVYGPEPKEPVTLLGRLESIYNQACYHSLLIFVLCGPWIVLWMLFQPKLWIISYLYICWLVYDRETPHKGGRKLKSMREWKMWESSRDYFPIKMVKTAELPPDQSYLFASFPHGVLPHGVTCNVLTNANRFNQAYPGLDPYIMTLNANFNFPILRDFMLFFGSCASSEKSILNVLSGPPGRVCVLIVGGVAEALMSYPKTYRLVLKNRKGFVKVALKSGASLVPVFSFGETNLYTQPSSPLYKKIQKKLRESFGVPFMMMKGRGIFQNVFGLLPYNKPIVTVIGKPIKVPKVEHPSQEIIDEYHQKFISELTDLFEKHKEKYDINGSKATIILK